MPDDPFAQSFARCARLVEQADGLLITAGAGLGVDSGLPDFRGPEGFWRAYPALGQAGLAFHEIASPQAFRSDPRLAWGFYGHRLALYRRTRPGKSFTLLAELAARLPQGAFIFTSNVDGQFQLSGFDPARIMECHGSIHHLQCMARCSEEIWPAEGFVPEVDEAACRLRGDLPICPRCGALARPNVLMFRDWDWIEARTAAQQARLTAWRTRVERLLVIEIGVGTAIPTVRHFGEATGAPLLRINPADPATRAEHQVSLPLAAADALRGIADALER